VERREDLKRNERREERSGVEWSRGNGKGIGEKD
jgi:hypothetical protein